MSAMPDQVSDVVKTAPSVSPSQIPDLLKIGSIPTNVQMSVDTDVLDSVVHNATYIRFVLQNKGILHSHSKIQLGFKDPTKAVYLPPNIGIASVIQRATLRVGNQTLSEVDDFSHFQAYKSQFMSSEALRERLPYLTGQLGSKKVVLNLEGDAFSSAEPPTALGDDDKGGGTSSDQSRGLAWDTGRNFFAKPGAYTSDDEQDMPPMMGLYVDDATWTTRPTWQIALSDLFPFLKTNQLPLYMMKEQIQLELQLHPEAFTGLRAWAGKGVTLAGADKIELDSTQTKMFADYQYYPQEMMIAYAQANQNLQFSYVDYRLSKLSFDEANTSQQIRNLGGAGRIITKVFWGFSDEDATANTSPLMKYVATAPKRSTGIETSPPITPSGVTRLYQNDTATYNVKYNNQFLFPIDVDNNARHFHNLVQAEGLTPYSTREEFSREGVSLTTKRLEGYDYQSFLGGSAFWCAMRLNKGERVNSRGVELYFTLNALPTKTNNYVLRAYLETIKFTTLKGGFVQSFLA